MRSAELFVFSRGRPVASARDLRRWIDEPKAYGLPRDVEDLLILVHAAQTQHSFYLHGAPFEPDIGNVPDELELRPFDAPPVELWVEARKIGGHVFGVAGSDLLDPDTLSRFAAKVAETLGQYGKPARAGIVCRATRESPSLSLGVSPRGATALLSTARAWAWLSGRAFVTPDDVKALARPTLRHRVAVRPEAELEGVTADGVLDGVLASVPVPR